MQPRILVESLVLAGTLALASCGSPGRSMKESGGPSNVDDLLNRVERVEIAAVVGKERAHEALAALRVLVAPEFQGDAFAAYTKLLEAVDQSQKQAAELQAAVGPMKKLADQVFFEWMSDLESFGNSQMRQRSQMRLEETRARYDAVHKTAVAVQIVYDALNADLADHALFLEHDLNASSVAMLANAVDDLSEKSRELDTRIDSCVAASKTYVEHAALRGQLAKPDSAAGEGAR